VERCSPGLTRYRIRTRWTRHIYEVFEKVKAHRDSLAQLSKVMLLSVTGPGPFHILYPDPNFI
jgi:hypothetical protein